MFCKQLIAAILVFGICGCSAITPAVDSDHAANHSPRNSSALPEGEGWWYARFYIDWPDGEEVRWYMGTLIGGEVIAPTLEKYRQDVSVWRVHRRAARDNAGHAFSFIFYSTPETAQSIYNTIENHAVVKSLLDSGRLTRLGSDDVNNIVRPNIEDTSDANWPVSVQKTWPAMIMGTSRMWLDLVSELASRESGIGGVEAKYKRVQGEITRIWQEEGQHAVLHHLNAIYAYQPLLIRY